MSKEEIKKTLTKIIELDDEISIEEMIEKYFMYKREEIRLYS